MYTTFFPFIDFLSFFPFLRHVSVRLILKMTSSHRRLIPATLSARRITFLIQDVTYLTQLFMSYSNMQNQGVFCETTCKVTTIRQWEIIIVIIAPSQFDQTTQYNLIIIQLPPIAHQSTRRKCQ